jgi:hypothetical protein
MICVYLGVFDTPGRLGECCHDQGQCATPGIVPATFLAVSPKIVGLDENSLAIVRVGAFLKRYAPDHPTHYRHGPGVTVHLLTHPTEILKIKCPIPNLKEKIPKTAASYRHEESEPTAAK